MIFLLWAFALVVPAGGNYKTHVLFVERINAGQNVDDIQNDAYKDGRRLSFAIILNIIAFSILIPLPLWLAIPGAIVVGFWQTVIEFVLMTSLTDLFHHNRPMR